MAASSATPGITLNPDIADLVSGGRPRRAFLHAPVLPGHGGAPSSFPATEITMGILYAIALIAGLFAFAWLAAFLIAGMDDDP